MPTANLLLLYPQTTRTTITVMIQMAHTATVASSYAAVALTTVLVVRLDVVVVVRLAVVLRFVDPTILTTILPIRLPSRLTSRLINRLIGRKNELIVFEMPLTQSANGPAILAYFRRVGLSSIRQVFPSVPLLASFTIVLLSPGMVTTRPRQLVRDTPAGPL